MAAAQRPEDEGRLIVLEGIDGSGKSTIAARVARTLRDQGHRVHATREPTPTFRGEAVRQALCDPEHDPISEALLFAADHAAHVADLRQRLADGQTVVSDRYSYSCLAYQGATLAKMWPADHQGTPGAWLTQVLAPFELVPSTVLLLDLPVQVALERVEDREDELEKFEQAAFLEDVRARYLDLAEKHGFEVIDASATIQETLAACQAALEGLKARGEV